MTSKSELKRIAVQSKLQSRMQSLHRSIGGTSRNLSLIADHLANIAKHLPPGPMVRDLEGHIIELRQEAERLGDDIS